jgi:uncharacterized protein YeaO (DUF488 family)
MSIDIKRVYEEFSPNDGFRILVDRLWPRGVKKESANIDLWLKNIAPSPELRKWFCHDPALFDTFKKKYLEELTNDPEKMEAVDLVQKKLQDGNVTLVYGAKDPIHNQAVVLKEFFKKE